MRGLIKERFKEIRNVLRIQESITVACMNKNLKYMENNLKDL